MTVPATNYVVRTTTPADFPAIVELCRRVYQETPPWTLQQLQSHLEVFPEGQLVAIDEGTGRLVGMAASLIVFWDDYEMTEGWKRFTESGMFTNHEPEHGHTLYGAEVMVDPDVQGKGIGKLLYEARRELTERLGLYRIRAGARLRGYSQYSDRLSPDDYVRAVEAGEIGDPTLSFQLNQGFKVLAVIPNYLGQDPESQGYAAVIEWINPHANRA
jgi:GNAT superfamily N-acetyltransferase